MFRGHQKQALQSMQSGVRVLLHVFETRQGLLALSLLQKYRDHPQLPGVEGSMVTLLKREKLIHRLLKGARFEVRHP